jgi:cytochrome c-type biogenesis protein CcmH
MTTYFWFAAGLLAGAAATLVAIPLFLHARQALAGPRRYLAVAATVTGFAVAALIIYRTTGSPDSLEMRPAARANPHPGIGDGQAGDSMESAVARLEARVANGGGSREDWALLAQSYDFLGRSADAARARARAEGAEQSTTAATAPDTGPALETYERRVRENPKDVEAWHVLANGYRQQRQFGKARDAFAALIKLDAMDADAWADYADALASASGGSLRGEPAKALDRALALDANHAKALWLKASLAHEEHQFADALRYWKRLQAVLPRDSSDARIVAANIEEASRLLGEGQPASSKSTATDTAAPAEVSGTVSIDPRLATRVPAGATLFIYAKAADSPGPPLAVLRLTAGSWPVRFRLDDTLAMVPSRRLSQFDQVIVEARISLSGQATPAAGDLFATSAVLRPGDHKPLALVIKREVS